MRQWRILFIDDEEVSRKSFLKLVDWEKYQCTVAGVFKDGETAWEFLKENPVDIVITDINMPFMDGIELLERIRTEYPGIRVLLLTGYEYFEYARKAVELKAFDFLLKPVTPERLVRAVEKAAFDIEKEEVARQAVAQSLELMQRDFVNRLFYGKIAKESLQEEAEAVNIPCRDCSYMVLIAAVDAREGQKIPDSETGEIKQNLQKRILEEKERLEKETGVISELYFVHNIGIHVQMLLVIRYGEVYPEEYIQKLTEAILQIGAERTDCILTLGVGKKKRLLEGVTESFEKVSLALKNRHILGLGKTIYDSDSFLERKSAEQIILPTETFLYHIRMGMTDEVEQDIDSIYKKFRHQEYLSLESAKMVTTELAITAFKGELSPQGESVSYLYYLNHIQQLNTLDEMEKDIKQFAVDVAKRRKNSGNHKKKMAEQAIEYLKANYMKEELSLNDVAGSLNISVPYLAVLFKQETGKNFGAHLLEIRMKKAKELLRTTDHTVSKIAEETGYSSSQYFSVCFKKYTGTSPGAYRDLQ